MNAAADPFRAIAYTSGAHLCGIAEYHERVAPYVPAIMHTERLPTTRVLRDRPIALVKQRLAYRRLAAVADSYDVILLQLINAWNNFRLGEYALPTFINRLRKPLVVVLHEWPDAIGEEMTETGLRGHSRRAAAAAVRRLDFRGLGFTEWLERVFFPRAQHVIVHAEHLRAKLLDAGVPADRVTCSTMPVYPLTGPAETPQVLRDIPAGARVVILFGFPHPRKRYDIALRALADLPQDAVMLLVGSDEGEFRRRHLDELREISKAHGVERRFLVTGEVETRALPAIFARADAALAPAEYATGSASLGYLIAAGVPIVSSDVESIAALRARGAGIETFPGGDPQACAAALRRVLDDDGLREELRLRNRRFSEVHTFDRLGELISERLRSAVEHARIESGAYVAASGARA
jgi:glycosyltransferase involved in cell wall biosynthesis